MDLKRYLTYFLIFVLIIIGLTACVRSRSPSAGATPSAPAGTGGTPQSTGDVMSQLELFVTQTAMAAQGQTGGNVATQAAPTTVAGTPVAQATPVAGGEATEPAPAEASPTSAPPAAPTATLMPFPSPTPGVPNNYTLQTGEFPFCIARRFDVDPADLLRINNLNANSTFYAGMTLKIPQSGSFPGARQLRDHPASHTVAAGETIYSIACLYGDADPNSIAAANGLKSPYRLSAGQKIQIP